MKRKNKEKKELTKEKISKDDKIIETKKTIYEIVGLTGDILTSEPKIVITGDYLIEIYNHKGIVDISDTCIKVNTKKAIYKVMGINLEIKSVTDDEIQIGGIFYNVERI